MKNVMWTTYEKEIIKHYIELKKKYKLSYNATIKLCHEFLKDRSFESIRNKLRGN